MGNVNIIIGTHALISDKVLGFFKNIGLVVIDEEQKFGVQQRNILADRTNVLISTATPIPRSHLLFVQDQYSVSTLITKPLNKRAVSTILYGTSDVDKIIERVGVNIKYGSKVFWVCASLNPVSYAPGHSAVERYEQLNLKFPGKVGLIHGKMSREEKFNAINKFSMNNSEMNILVCTSIIEVGMDVPDASILIVDRAEQFGLSQLHQIRGRIGRGDKPAGEKLETCSCVLLFDDKTSNNDDDDDKIRSKEKLKILRDNDNGFTIADEDLRMRGPGDLFGTRQSGDMKYNVATLPYHSNLLDEARVVAGQIHKYNLNGARDLRVSNIIVRDPLEDPLMRIYMKDDCDMTKRGDIANSKLSSTLTNENDNLHGMIEEKMPSLHVEDNKIKTSDSQHSGKMAPEKPFDIDNYLIIIFDLETTGLDSRNDRIIQIGACVLGDKNTCFDALVYSTGTILRHQITLLTGINISMLQSDGKSFHSAWMDFMKWVDVQRHSLKNSGRLRSSSQSNDLLEVILISHNGARFDFNVLNYEINRIVRSSGQPSNLTDWIQLWDTPRPSSPIGQYQYDNRIMERSHVTSSPFWLLDSLSLIKDESVSNGYSLPQKKLGFLYEFVTGKNIINHHNALSDVHTLDTVLESDKFKLRWRNVAINYIYHIRESFKST